MVQVSTRQGGFRALGQAGSLQDRLAELHQALRAPFPWIHRLAVALHDSGRVRTFLQSNLGPAPLALYEASLAEAPDLGRLAETGEARLVQDLAVFEGAPRTHTRALREAGFASSYTLPFSWQGRLEAFIFFNSREAWAFDEARLGELDLWGHLVGTTVIAEVVTSRSLVAALRTAVRMMHLRDPETGGHLERMAAFSRLIAQDLARRGLQSFDDEAIESLAGFAPMHDVGKIGIPDAVLMKPGALTEEERAIMRGHAVLGLELVEDILGTLGADRLDHVELLRQITGGHHERMDGSGYPEGLSGDRIPVASRIIAVADVFDALTSHRPYKEPWSNEAAFDYLRRQAASTLDHDCVEAFLGQGGEVERIQAEFRG